MQLERTTDVRAPRRVDDGQRARPSLHAPSASSPTTSGDGLATLTRIVEEAADECGVELVVRSPTTSGTIHVCRGSIAWVVEDSGRERLSEVLIRRAQVSFATLRQTYQQCRIDGSNFGEQLVERGIVDRATVRSALLEHNARQLHLLLGAEPATIEIVPRRRIYASELVFSMTELVEEMRRMPRQESPMANATSNEDAPASTNVNHLERKYDMANINQSLDEVMNIDGAIASAIVDWESGLTLGTVGGGGKIDIELAASGNTSVVKAKMAVMRQLGIGGVIEDMLITLESQYHLIRPLAKHPSLFLYLAIDRQRGNLGLARHKLRQIEEALVL